MVHRLDPRYPLVWRSPSSVQIGIDPARVVLDEVDPVAERMLAALVTGATEGALRLLSGGFDPEPLLAALAPVLEVPEPEPGKGVAVFGLGHTAVRISRLLAERDRWHSGNAMDQPYPDAVVIVSHYVTRPAARSLWLRRDVPHLPVVYSDTGVMIGPLVIPGNGPCLTCVEFHHRDRDLAWPALAAQLLDRVSSADQGTLSAETAVAAVRMLAAGRVGVSLRIDAETGERTETTVAQHPHCTCNGGGALASVGSAELGEEAAGGARAAAIGVLTRGPRQ